MQWMCSTGRNPFAGSSCPYCVKKCVKLHINLADLKRQNQGYFLVNKER